MSGTIIENPHLAERFESFASTHSEDIQEAIQSNLGINTFFKGFLQSEVFASLSPKEKAEAFNNFLGIYGYLEAVNGLLVEHETM